MRQQYPLFQSHLDLAHSYWEKLIRPGDHLVDATCGNGQDTLILSRLALSEDTGHLYALDIQSNAIELTKKLLVKHLSPIQMEHVSFHHGCHSSFPSSIVPDSIALFAYNLGYLPGSDKQMTTNAFTTLESIKKAQTLLKPGGLISITCYPGHPEGAREKEAILDFVKNLDPKEWNCCFHEWLNRKKAPGLLLLQKPNPTTLR